MTARDGRRRRCAQPVGVPGPMVALVVALVAALVGAIVVGCAPGRPTEPGPAAARPLTELEANRLAVVRFGNYRAGGRHFTATVTNASGPLSMAGDLDTRAHVGYAAAEFTDAGRSTVAVLRWTPGSVSTWLDAGDGRTPPPALPAAPPQRRALQPPNSTVDAVLRLLLGLSSDRPENAVLLRQSDARWLRQDHVGGTVTDVIQGPSAGSAGSSLRYWMDSGGRLLRVEAGFPGARAVVDLGPGFVPIPHEAGS